MEVSISLDPLAVKLTCKLDEGRGPHIPKASDVPALRGRHRDR